MDGVHLFTQDEKYLAARNKRLFLAVGLLPLLFASVLITWSGGSAGKVLGIGPSQMMLLLPVVVAFQFLVLAIRRRVQIRTILRLTPEAISIETGHESRRFQLDTLREIKVVRDQDKKVHRLSLQFAKERVRLEGFLGMNTLRDLLVLYAGAVPDSTVQVRDPMHA